MGLESLPQGAGGSSDEKPSGPGAPERLSGEQRACPRQYCHLMPPA